MLSRTGPLCSIPPRTRVLLEGTHTRISLAGEQSCFPSLIRNGFLHRPLLWNESSCEKEPSHVPQSKATRGMRSKQALLMTAMASGVTPCWGLRPDTCVPSSRAEVQTQPLTWSAGPVQSLVGNGTQIGSLRPCHLKARDASVGRPVGHLGKCLLFLQHVLSWIHFLIEFSHYSLPSLSCREYHIPEGRRVPPLPA